MHNRLDFLMCRLDVVQKDLNTQCGGNRKGFKDAQKINELLRLKKIS